MTPLHRNSQTALGARNLANNIGAPDFSLRRESIGRATAHLIIWALAAIVVGVAIPFVAEMMR